MKLVKNLRKNVASIMNLLKVDKNEIKVCDVEAFMTLIHEIDGDLLELEKIMNYSNAAIEKEMVSHPSHYQGNKIECIDAMLDVFGKEKVSAFCELNAFKYIWRSDSKGTDLQDKRKAIWYLDKYNELNKEQYE